MNSPHRVDVPPIDFPEWIERANNISNNQDFRDVCEALCSHFRFDHYVYSAVIVETFLLTNSIILTNIPLDWLARYFTQGYKQIDPTIDHCIRHVMPTVFSDMENSPALNKNEKAFFEDQKSHGIKNGVAFCAKNRMNAGFFSFVVCETDENFPYYAKSVVPFLQTLGTYLHERLLEIYEIEPQSRALITNRERECIMCKANGLSDKETAEKLGIAARTVAQHLDNVAEKMGMDSRKQAAAQSLLMGMISTVDMEVVDITPKGEK